MHPSHWSRRSAAAGLFALAGCAAPAPPELVNLMQAGETVPPPGGLLETAFDRAVRMTVPVRLDGQGPFTFVVDTGANVSVISIELAAQLKLPVIGQADVHGIAGKQLTDLTRVERLQVGAFSAPIPRMPMLPRQRMGAEGLLGMDVLRRRRLVMDFQNRRLEIAPSIPAPVGTPVQSYATKRSKDPIFVVPARVRFGQLIIIDSEIAGVRVTAFLDSGSQNTVGNEALKSAVVRRHSGFADRLITAPLISATGQTVVGQMASMPPLRLGGLLVGNLTIAFADLHIFGIWGLLDRPALLVGADVLRQFHRVEIDYGRRLVTFRPPAEYMTLRPR